MKTRYAYIITNYPNGDVISISKFLYNSLKDAEREAWAEILLDKYCDNGHVEKVATFDRETTYNIYDNGKVSYALHIIKFMD